MIADAAMNGSVGAAGLSVFAIIFFWQPPHVWAIALYRKADYEAAGIPMLPSVVGDERTRWWMLASTLALVPVTLAPFALGPSLEGPVVRQHEVRPIRDDQVLPHLHTPRGKPLQLLFQGPQIDDHAVPHDAQDPSVEDARGEQVEDELLLLHVDGVSSVGPTLVPGDDVGPFGQDIDDFPLTLVPPLTSHNHGALTSIYAFGHGNPGSFRGSGMSLPA